MSPSSSNFISEILFSMDFVRYFQSGVMCLLWLAGLALCLTRTDIPKSVRVLFGATLSIWLFLLGMWIIIPAMIARMVTYTSGDIQHIHVIFIYLNTFLRLIAGVLLLYVIFGPRRRAMDWEPGVMETD